VETGALAGGGAGAGVGIGGLLGGGVADVLGGALGGAAGGALGGVATGQNVGTGALTGAAGGALSGGVAAFGGVGGTPGAAGTAGAAPGAGTGAGGIAAPAGTTPDIGMPLDVSGGSLGPGSGIGSPLDVSQGGFGSVTGIGADTGGGGVGGGGAAVSPSTTSTLGSISGSNSGFGLGDDNVGTANVAFNETTDGSSTPPGSTGSAGNAISNWFTGNNPPPSGGGFTTADVTGQSIPIPPVPPSLDASGNPQFDASGNPIYPTQDAAQAAAAYNASGGVGTTAPPGPGGLPGIINSIFGGGSGSGSGIGSFLGQHANLLIPAAGLGYEALKANQGLSNIPGYNPLQATAGQLSTQGQELQNYITSGTLPPGVQTQLNQAQQQAEAQIRGMYASRGMSGSSAEVTDLNNVRNTVISQGSQIAMNLLQTGVNESGLSANLYAQILQQSLNQDNQLGQGIAALAGAAARPTINLAGSANG
jgi:hypothetical protein